MNNNGLEIDFSWSIDKWISAFKRLIDILVDFFDSIGIKLLKDSEPAETEGE